MGRFICIHGHFYQPPRENPWLESIELEDSAYPYHDWNERITAECYATNAQSRILDEKGYITHIVNNYASISFNFGPTLLSWMERAVPDVYEAILDADKESQVRFSGHGSALAQAYNHMILPLANRRDKVTQVKWGIRDFERRFGRKPEGLWLPETAVDLDTLDILAEHDIRFTILAPHQARRMRKIDDDAWSNVDRTAIDPSRAYTLSLPSGRRIALFFYDGPISRAVAFENLLSSGEQFSARLVSAFSDERTWPQLSHISTDGETYGHHHQYGDMALAYALHYIERTGSARITNYGEFLERNPPAHDVEIVEATSWSCSHGVERWKSNCGCNSGGHAGWTQEWRGPLCAAFDWLRDTLAPLYEKKAREFLKSPWDARDAYIEVILDRSPQTLDAFLSAHASRPLSTDERITVLKLLECGRHTMLMYTSCGWFFDELSGIETVQVIQYATRALQLAEDVSGQSLESAFLERLEKAPSNLPTLKNGKQVYQDYVKPAQVDLAKVAAHFAISSLFVPYEETAKIYSYTVQKEDAHVFNVGRAKLAAGRLHITSMITHESGSFSFGVLHLGDHNITCGVRRYKGESAYQEMLSEIVHAFNRADFPEVIRLLDTQFGPLVYSLKTLFRDEQRKILAQVLRSSLADAESIYRQLYESYAPLMRFLTDIHTPLSKGFRTAAEVALTSALRTAINPAGLDLDRIPLILKEAEETGVVFDESALAPQFEQTIEALAQQWRRDVSALDTLTTLSTVIRFTRTLPFLVNFWKTQNVYYDILMTDYPQLRAKAQAGDPASIRWIDLFLQLGDALSVAVEDMALQR